VNKEIRTEDLMKERDDQFSTRYLRRCLDRLDAQQVQIKVLSYTGNSMATQIKALREALEKYADIGNWDNFAGSKENVFHIDGYIECDGYEIAQQALKKDEAKSDD